MNEFDARVLNLINQERLNAGLNPLVLNSQLDLAAERHSEDMALRDFFDHTGSDGSSLGQRIQESGYQYRECAENIGPEYTTPEAGVQAWMNSPGHRANILNPNFEDIGVGYYHLSNDTGSTNYNRYWTLTLGADGSSDGEIIPAGIAPGYPPYRNSNDLNESQAERVYRFSLSDPSSINLALEIDVPLFGVGQGIGDDADLYLYEDSNGNGVFDINDQSLASSTRWGNSDDSINYRAPAGTYFAKVASYSLGVDGYLDYNLDLSATPQLPYLVETDPPNLLSVPTGYQIDFNQGWYWNINQSVGDTNTADTYKFSMELYGGVNINLTGLTGDADLRIVQDFNQNNIVDPGEVIRHSTQSGSTSEWIYNIENSGDYFLQVYQYSGNTNYLLTLDYYSTPYA